MGSNPAKRAISRSSDTGASLKLYAINGIPNGYPNYTVRATGRTGTVEATVFQNTVDYPDGYAHAFHATLDYGTWVTVKQEQVAVG